MRNKAVDKKNKFVIDGKPLCGVPWSVEKIKKYLNNLPYGDLIGLDKFKNMIRVSRTDRFREILGEEANEYMVKYDGYRYALGNPETIKAFKDEIQG